MGNLTAELPDKQTLTWAALDPQTVALFLTKFRKGIENRVKSEPEIMQQTASFPSFDALVEGWIFGMAKHILTTPTTLATREWRRMFLLYRLLTADVPPDAGYPTGTTFGDLIPDHDIEFRELEMTDAGFAFACSIERAAATTAKPKTQQVHVSVDWAPHASFEPRKKRLIKELRPHVMRHVDELFQKAWAHLQRQGPEVQSTTLSGYVEMARRNETVFIFIGMLVNRDLPPGAAVFLAPTQEIIELMGDSWHKAAEIELGAKPV